MHNEHSSRQALINPQDEIAFIAMYAGFVVVFSQSTNLKHVQLQVLAKENGRRTGASYASASMILSKRRKILDAGCSHRVSKSGLSGFQPTGLRWSHFRSISSFVNVERDFNRNPASSAPQFHRTSYSTQKSCEKGEMCELRS